MDLLDWFSQLGGQATGNLNDSSKMVKDATRIALERLKQQNPNYMGPPVPDAPLPAEQQFNDATTAAVMGSLHPVAADEEVASGLIQKLKKTLGTESDHNLLENAFDAYSSGATGVTEDMVKAAHQKAAQQQFFKDRLTNQTAIRKGKL